MSILIVRRKLQSIRRTALTGTGMCTCSNNYTQTLCVFLLYCFFRFFFLQDVYVYRICIYQSIYFIYSWFSRPACVQLHVPVFLCSHLVYSIQFENKATATTTTTTTTTAAAAAAAVLTPKVYVIVDVSVFLPSASSSFGAAT